MNDVMEATEDVGRPLPKQNMRPPDLAWQAAQGRLVPEYQVALLAEGLTEKLRERLYQEDQFLLDLVLVMRDAENELRLTGSLGEGSAIGLFQDLIPAMRWVYD